MNTIFRINRDINFKILLQLIIFKIRIIFRIRYK